MTKLLILAVITSIVLSGIAEGQRIVTLKLKNNFKINYTPFNEIQVLDNRFDTSKIFTVEDGQYPPTYLTFLNGASFAIKDYLEGAIKKLSRGNKSLLINIRQLRVPNKTYILKREGKLIRRYDERKIINFFAELFYKTDDNYYRKIVTINKQYYTYGFIDETLPLIFNNLIDASSISDNIAASLLIKTKKLKYILEDSISYKYEKDSIQYTIEQINSNERRNWEKLPIMSKNLPLSGIFETFDDFKNNTVTANLFQIKYQEKDSFYTVIIPDTNSKHKQYLPWAVCDSGKVYMHLYKNIYIELHKLNSSFYFDVPNTLPDMYALLSMEENNTNRNTYNNSSGNLMADLTGLLVSYTASEIMRKTKENKILKEGLKNNFRSCFIDMSCGDIIY